MTRAPRNAPFAAFLLALGLVAGSGPSLAAKPAPPPVPGGPIGTPLPQYDFRAVTGSNYKTPDGVRGSYLMTGDQIIMTGGELKGTRMHRTSKGFLRHVGTDGLDNDIRCVLTNAGRGPLEPEDSINQTEE